MKPPDWCWLQKTNQPNQPNQPDMKNTILMLASLGLVAVNTSCSSMGTNADGRRYHMATTPIQSKAGSGLTFTEPKRPVLKSSVQAVSYHHSPAPIPSKTGLQVAHNR